MNRDPNDLTSQDEKLARILSRNCDLEAALRDKLGLEPAEDPDALPVDADGEVIHEPATDVLQGSAQVWVAGTPSGLEGELAAAVGLGPGLTLRRNRR